MKSFVVIYTIILVSTFLTISLGRHHKTKRRQIHYQHRIINGKAAKVNQFPYQVSVQQLSQSQNSYQHLCGGSILNEKHVLTAAHCTIVNNNMRIRAGILHLDDSSTIGAAVKVHRVFVHPGYYDDNGDISANDIAILRLEKNLVLSDGIQPVQLPTLNETFTGEATLSGWGRRNSLVPVYSNTLMYADLALITLDECKADFINASGTYGPLNDDNICTHEDDKYACQGDSGGPLVQNGTIVGVVSYSANPCDLNGSPTAYAEVSKYVPWIDEQIKQY